MESLNNILDIVEEIEYVAGSQSANLKLIYESNKRLDKERRGIINFSEPVIKMGNIKLIFPKTTNLIQGYYGVHKSRFIEHLIATILMKTEYDAILDMEYSSSQEPYIILIDTEREQDTLAYSIQTIFKQAGYDIDAEIEEFFFYSSFIEIKKQERLESLQQLLADLRMKYPQKHFFLFIDTLTDLVSNFNDPKESSALVDYINVLRTKHECTIISVMHENPPSTGIAQKAKGHLGTLIVEKSSTVLSISYEKGSKDILKLEFKKTRRSRIPDTIQIKFDEYSKSLVKASESEIAELRQEKAHTRTVLQNLFMLLETAPDKCQQKSVCINKLTDSLNASERLIKARLKEIEENKLMLNHGYNLIIERDQSDSRKVIYRLESFSDTSNIFPSDK
jgi:hypothetical protein